MGTSVLYDRPEIIEALENGNHDLIIDYLDSQLKESDIPSQYGLTILKREFGKGNPFSDSFLNKLDTKDERYIKYKNKSKQEIAKRREQDPTTKHSNESRFRTFPKAVQEELLIIGKGISNQMHHFTEKDDD